MSRDGKVERERSIKSKATFDKEGRHRYILERVWEDNSSKAMASVIMFNPSYANEIIYDYTTMKVTNYLISNSNYKGVYILNLYSIIETDSKKVKKGLKLENKKENDECIDKCFKNSKKVYIAWGANKNNEKRIKEIIKILKNNNFNNVYELIDEDGQNKHPSRCTIVGEQSKSIEEILTK